jgi:putative Ca2+/H+ antiporter (TMEM165/GDT1 family)
MNWPLFFSIYSIIFLAELPDKTAFATLLMASKGRPAGVFLGVALAFFAQCFVAVGFGHLLGLFPERWVHLGAGVVFLGFAAYTWYFHDKDEEAIEGKAESTEVGPQFSQVMARSFMVVFIAEWGDLTQLATASFSARYHSDQFTVFCAAVTALWSVTAIAVLVGQRLQSAIHPRVMKYIGTAVFAAVGLYFLIAS